MPIKDISPLTIFPMNQSDDLLQRAQSLIERLEGLFSPASREPDWDHLAFRWRGGRGLQAVAHPHKVRLDDLLCMERQKADNTRQFVEGRSANNVLLWVPAEPENLLGSRQY